MKNTHIRTGPSLNTTGRMSGVLLAAVLAIVALTPTLHADDEVDAAAKQLMAAAGFAERGLHDLAQAEYADFLARHPNHPDANTARYGLALSHYKQQHYKPVIDLMPTVLGDKTFEHRADALAVLGHALMASEQYDKAIANFDTLLKDFPTSPHTEMAGLNRVQALYALKRDGDVIKSADAFAKTHPNSARLRDVYYFKALSQQRTGEHGDAVSSLEALMKLSPEGDQRLDTLLLMGQGFEDQNKLKQAVAQYEQFIAEAPKARAPEGRYALALALYKQKAYDKAKNQLNMIVKDHKDSDLVEPARFQLGLTQLAAGEHDAAATTLSYVAERDKQRMSTATYWLAQSHIAGKRYREALSLLRDMAKADPAPANLDAVTFDIAVCLAALEEFEDAQQQYAAYVKAYPEGAQVDEAIYRRAFCLHRLERYADSQSLCSQLMADKQSSQRVPAMELAAENLFLQQKYTEAEGVLKQLLADADGARHARFLYRLGQAAYFKGDYERATTLLGQLAADENASKDDVTREGLFLLGDAQLQRGEFKAAAASLDQYLSAWPIDKLDDAGLTKAFAESPAERLEARFKLALAQLRMGQTDQAAAAFNQLMLGPADSPWVTRSMFEYGQLRYQQQQYDDAEAALRKVLAVKAADDIAAPSMYLLAWIDYERNDYPAAAKAFDAMVKKYPKHPLAPEAAYQHAVAVREDGNVAAALKLFQDYVDHYPDNENTASRRYMVGVAQAQLGQHDEAVKTLAALADNPATRSDVVLYELAWAYRSTEQPDKAVDAYSGLLKDYPDSSRVTVTRTELAELLYVNERFEEAAALLEKVSADANAPAETWMVAQYRLGWCYAKLGEPAKAAKVFDKAASQQPKHELAASALYQAGLAYSEAGEPKQAEVAYNALLTNYASSELGSIALLKLGEYAAAREDYASSAKYYKQYLDGKPDERFVYLAEFGMGWAAENTQKYTEARLWYDKVIQVKNSPTAARAQFQIGETYFAQGKFDEAARELLKVDIIYDYPEWSAPALYEAGRAFEQLGDKAKAKAQYERIVGHYGDQPIANDAKARIAALDR